MLTPNSFYKLIPESDFDAANITDCVRLSPLDLQSGFMHLSFGRQAMNTVQNFFKGAGTPLAIALDMAELQHHGITLRVESNKPGGEQYPHLYGTQKIPLAAVTKVWHLVEQVDGSWGVSGTSPHLPCIKN